jgi:hypothetical protein
MLPMSPMLRTNVGWARSRLCPMAPCDAYVFASGDPVRHNT